MKWMGQERSGHSGEGHDRTGQDRTKLGEGVVTMGRTVHDKMT